MKRKNTSVVKSHDEYPVIINNVDPHHTNSCVPGKNQLLLTNTRAGVYSKATSLVLNELVKYMVLNPNGYADAPYIRSLMTRALPNRKSVTSQDIYNVRLRAIMFMTQIKSEGKEIDKFHFNIEDAERLFKLPDEIDDDFIDKCVSGAKVIYYD